ncbi:hypothetical protein Tco_1024539 [Tanacetum coccineum]
MVDDNVGNPFRQNAVQNVRHLVGQNAVQNQGIQNVRNHNGLSVVLGIANQHGNGNVVAARAEGNSNGINRNPIRCYNCQGEGHYATNYTEKPRKRDAAYLQTQLQIAQKEEAGIQLNSEEFEFIAATDGSAKVHNYDNCYDNEIFNMFTQEEQYTKLLEPIHEPHQVQLNDSNVTSKVSSVEQDGGKTDQHPETVEDTQADESLAKHKSLELEIERLLRAVVSQDIMSIVQSNSVEDTSNLQTELERMKERFENCIIKKENEYSKLWNDWYKKCEEYKYDKISYDKTYNDME